MNRRTRNRARAAFTLLEATVAITVIGIVISSMLLSISNYSRLTRIETLGEAALTRCQEKMEQIRGLNYDRIIQENFPHEDGEGDPRVLLDSRGTTDPGDDVLGSRFVTIDEIALGGDPNNTAKLVTVTFEYQVRGGYTEETLPETYRQTLTTLISAVD